MWFGLFELPIWGYVLVTLGLTHITIASVTIFLHRHQAHRALDLHPIPSHFFRFWLWMTTGMVTIEWVAIHRKHHAKCETEDDPHSPQIKGLSEILWNGTAHYRAASKDQDMIRSFGQGTPNDWIERNVYRRFPFLGVTLMAFINIGLFGPIGLTIWAVQMIWIPFFAAGVINGVGHYLGYRNFEPNDASTNISPWGILIGGEELHNNHHAFPSSAKLSSKPWEFDLGWFYIRCLEVMGLAKTKRVAPKPAIVDKADMDLDTVASVMRGKVHVLAIYARQVIYPSIKEELHHADDACRRLIKRARRAMVREDSLVSPRARQRLEKALDISPRLEAVYQYRQRLQAIWQTHKSNRQELLEQLKEWCANAEASGIQALQDFARNLRGFTVVAQPA